MSPFLKKKLPLLISFLLVTVFSAEGAVITPELGSVLQALPPEAEIPVIITLSDKVDVKILARKNRNLRPGERRLARRQLITALKSKANLSQAPLKIFLRDRKAKRVKSLWISNTIAATLSKETIGILAKNRGIEKIKPDRVIPLADILPADAGPSEWNIDMIHAPELWDLGYRGGDIIVAAMDTGVDADHPDLSSKYRGGDNSWFDPNAEHDFPYDAHGHGTMVMGVILGGSAGGSSIGVAPDAKWIAVKIFDDSGETTLSKIQEGFQWLLDPDGNPDTDDAPDVVNNSWGDIDSVNQCMTDLDADIAALKAAGIAEVFAAGNSGPNFYTSIGPANCAQSFAAGALNSDSTIYLYSSRGPSACDASIYPEVTAPGAGIKTADLTFGGIFPDSYASVSGTSVAAPHVAGAMALLLNAHPGLTVSELEDTLKNSAIDLGEAGPDNDYGNGLIDITQAHNLLLGLPPIVKAGLDNDPREDIVIDFGPGYGIWVYYNNGVSYLQLHNLSSDSIISADLDPDPIDDLILDFGAQSGIWICYNNGATWSQLHNLSPESVTIADLDADGLDELVVDFGPAQGMWLYYNNGASWSQLYNLSPESINAADLDNNGQAEIIMDFGPDHGIWIYYNNNNWIQLHSLNPESIVTADLDNNGYPDIIIDFGPDHGIWICYNNNTNWIQLHDLNPESITTADLDNNGQADIILDFGEQYGVWVCYNNGASWSQLHNLSPKTITSADLDDNGNQDLIIDFGQGYGIWVRYDNFNWTQLHNLSP